MDSIILQDILVSHQKVGDSSSLAQDEFSLEAGFTLDTSDSDMALKPVKPEVPASLFTDKKVESVEPAPVERKVMNHDWLTIHFIVCLGLLAWVQVFYRKRLVQIMKAFTGGHYLNQLEREGNLFRERIVIPLIIVYLVSFSSLLYLGLTRIMDLTLFELSGFKLFSLIMLAVLLMWFLKNIFITLIGNVFKNFLLLTDYLLINLATNIVFGIILLPIVVLAFYMSSVTLIYIGLIIWGIIFIFRIFRELFTVLSYTKFSLFPRILYLCTFEFVPLLVLTKLVMSYLT
jgi:hypothetical protein